MNSIDLNLLLLLFLYLYVHKLIFSVDNSTDKPKQFRWNFHKKTKSSATNSSQNGNGKAIHETNSITEEGIARVYELIDFILKEDSKLMSVIF